MSGTRVDFLRPYLVIPKLIEQPTWGGQYIATAKQWEQREELVGRKIGQSYELFSGSNLSLLTSSADSLFVGELTDRDAVQIPTTPSKSVSLAHLIASSPDDVLGKDRVAKKGNELNFLIKFTQALGNSFQLHIKDGTTHPFWKPKPESWYYFEPGLITLGVRPDIDWVAYKTAVTAIGETATTIGANVADGSLSYEQAEGEMQQLVKAHDPWAFVNKFEVKKDELIDLSGGGVHHSWEEDSATIPLGNVLYELQLDAMDDVSTLRNFDKGKIGRDGSVRQLHIDDYFALIDRTPETNDPLNHVCLPDPLISTSTYKLDRLLKTKYYTLEKLVFSETSSYAENIVECRHVFVKAGGAEVSTASGGVVLTTGHSCFIPAGAREYRISNTSPSTEILISY